MTVSFRLTTAIAALLLTVGVSAQPSDESASATSAGPDTSLLIDEEAPTDAHADWLDEVEPLITAAERRMFGQLRRTYQRDAFIQAFWRVRDPYSRTTRNELKDRWPVRLAEARSRFGSLTDDRSRILLVHDRSSRHFEVRCTATRIPAEVWVYDNGSDHVDYPFVLLFMRFREDGPMRLWRPSTAMGTEQLIQRYRPCVNGSLLSQVVNQVTRQADEYERTIAAVLTKPRPNSQEWVQTFVAQSTEMPAGAKALGGTVSVEYPGRHQNRTVVQVTVALDMSAVETASFAGYRSRDLHLTGEIVVDDQLFEGFRYKYGFPAAEIPAAPNGEAEILPLAFQRYLRPGRYRMILRVDDLNGEGVMRVERTLEVPEAHIVLNARAIQDPLTATLFAEAIAAIEAGETNVKLRKPAAELLTGFVRFDAVVAGNEIERVRFLLDDKVILTKNRPPFSVRIDLGPFPDLHVLRVEGLDDTGRELASDETLLNGGGYRFAVKLIEPRRGRIYEKSLRVRFEVEIPEDRSLDRVEVFLDETRVATLFQAPWVHPVALPEGEPVTYVRAVAYLPDGNATEDLVFINAPDHQDIVDVQMVELYTSVLDAGGRPVEGLTAADFAIREDGVAQSLNRFERVEDLPIHTGILIDNSASMHGTLDEVRKAALSFFQQAIHAKDRAAVVTFNSFPHLAVKLTSDRAALGAGLAGLVAEGQTALFDSLMFTLYYFTGIRGQRAILVLSDGKDESSRFTFEQTLDYARRAGITLYTIGLRLRESTSRRKLARLADETGGRSFFIDGITDLGGVYSVIQRELRSQYLVAYQSSNTSGDDGFRRVDLEVDRPAVTVKTLSGYYP